MNNFRKDFPILQVKEHTKPLIFFDNASTSQKPQVVIDAISQFYAHHNANVGRGIYSLAETATSLYEQARAAVAQFIGAQPEEVVFTRGTTESINLVAATWAREQVKQGDEILLTELEHHSNLLPWQRLAQENNAVLKFIPVDELGVLRMDLLDSLLTARTKIVSVTHVSNSLGTRNDIKTIIRKAHAVGARVLIDAAQSVPHEKINVYDLACDFLAFSGHKMLAPTGIGVLYIKKELHEDVPAYQLGGGMVYEAGLYDATLLKIPHKLEAGTPAIAQAIGLQAAINYLNKIDFEKIREHEAQLCSSFIDGLSLMKNIQILGPIEQLKKNGHLVSFTVNDMHPHDVAAYLDQFGICVRAGHQCAQPLAKRLGIDSSVRVSFYLYNTTREVERCVDALARLHLK